MDPFKVNTSQKYKTFKLNITQKYKTFKVNTTQKYKTWAERKLRKSVVCNDPVLTKQVSDSCPQPELVHNAVGAKRDSEV